MTLKYCRARATRLCLKKRTHTPSSVLLFFSFFSCFPSVLSPSYSQSATESAFEWHWSVFGFGFSLGLLMKIIPGKLKQAPCRHMFGLQVDFRPQQSLVSRYLTIFPFVSHEFYRPIFFYCPHFDPSIVRASQLHLALQNVAAYPFSVFAQFWKFTLRLGDVHCAEFLCLIFISTASEA